MPKLKTVSHGMKTTVSAKGRIALPAEIREQYGIAPGQEFEVERIDRGDYRLSRTALRRNQGLISLLLACPVKDWFKPTDRRRPQTLECPNSDDQPRPEHGWTNRNGDQALHPASLSIR